LRYDRGVRHLLEGRSGTFARSAAAGTLLALGLLAACASFSSDPAVDPSPDGGSEGEAAAPVGDGATDADCGAACGATVIARNVPQPTSIAVLAGKLFWSDTSSAIWSCDPAACVPQPLVVTTAIVARVAASTSLLGAVLATCSSGAVKQPELMYQPDGTPAGTARAAPCPTDVVGRGSDLLFVNRGDLSPVSGTNWSVTKCAADGSCFDVVGSPIVSPNGQPERAALVDGAVYIGTSAGRLVQWKLVPDAGAPAVVVSGGERFNALAVTDTRLFWIGLLENIRTCDRDRCTPHDVSNDTTVQAIAGDAKGLYWTSAATGRGDGRVMFLANDRTAPEPVVTGAIAPTSLAVDDRHVYFGNASDAAGDPSHGSIVRVPKR
jgi:hypothetical protein